MVMGVYGGSFGYGVAVIFIIVTIKDRQTFWLTYGAIKQWSNSKIYIFLFTEK